MSYDAMTAHTTVVFTRYMMLSLESCESNDERSLGDYPIHYTSARLDLSPEEIILQYNWEIYPKRHNIIYIS